LHPSPAAEAVALKPTASEKDAATRRSLPVFFLALALGTLWFILCRHLSNEWSINEQYNYGWFVPFFALYLFWLRWEDRPSPEVPPLLNSGVAGRSPAAAGKLRSEVGRWCAVILIVGAAAILLPLRIFEIGNPDWRPLAWLHAAAVVAITLTTVWAIGGIPWLWHFAFPILFIFVAVPWVSPIEEPILQGLMRGVAAIAAQAVTLFGIPAQVEGNLIRVSSGVVGVNEACSGVRSLQTSLMIGLLFGELKRLSLWQRIFLVIAGVGIALFANFLRVLFLVTMASRAHDVSAVNKWHDLAGYGILLIVFLGTMLIAAKVGGQKAEVRDQRPEVRNRTIRVSPTTDHRSPITNHFFPFLALFIWLVAVEAGAELWYRAHERNLAAATHWDVRWPESSPGFHEIPIDDGVRGALRFDKGREARWLLPPALPADPAATCFLFFFRWEPGTSTILRARAHRPDICLPSAGWRQIADGGVRPYPVTPEVSLRFRHFTFVRDATANQRRLFAYAFFCLREDTLRAADVRSNQGNLESRAPGGWSPPDRLRVVREGLRNPGQQVMELIMMTPREIGDADAETQFEEMLPKLIEVKKSEN
jgi:exosortase